MKYWAQKAFAGFAQLIALFILTCTVPAFAQFEVSPDHFDSSPGVKQTPGAKTSIQKIGAPSAQAGKHQAQIAAAGSNAQTSGVSAGQSQGNAAAAKRKKRVPVNKTVLASTQ